MTTQLSLLAPEPAWNPRYVEYARAHGATPEEMEVRDRGRNTEFIIWIMARWREWERITKRKEPHGVDAHAAFDAWLSTLEPTTEAGQTAERER